MSEREQIRLLIADDQALFADSLTTFLKNYARDIQVLGVARDGRSATVMAEQLRPEIILMDVYMPQMNGVEAAEVILQKFPEIRIIMLSTYDEDEYVRQALEHGASGYLLKDISPTELIASIRALRSGVVQISPQIASKLVRGLHESRTGLSDLTEKFEWFESLTKRERQVFFLLATGYDNAQIAEELNLAEQTVRNQVSMIYSKLEIKDRFQIIQLANQLGSHSQQ